MTISRSLILAMASLVLFGAASASAQGQLVGYQQRFFEKYGDGSTSGDSDPCCGPGGTFSQRQTGGPNNTDGAYFAEFKNALANEPFIFNGMSVVPNPNNRPNNWYGFYQPGTGGVTLKRGRFTSTATLHLVFNGGMGSGGNLRKLTTTLERTVLDLVMRPGGGPGNFAYDANSTVMTGMGGTVTPHVPGIPTFRTPGTWLGPYPSMAGALTVQQGPLRFGGTRAIIHQQISAGVNVNTNPDVGDRFNFVVANGPGLPFTPMNVVRRETRQADYFKVEISNEFDTTGPISGSLMQGTGWFTILPYTTGMVIVSANELGVESMDFTTRTDSGINTLMQTTMGGVVGTLQLVSGHLLQSRGGSNTNLGGTNLTRITFTPEPASAALLAVGAIGLAGLVVRDRRRNQI